MAKLKSMAYTKAEQKNRNNPKVCESPYSGDKYPWGLRIDLNTEALKKLGVKTLPKSGTKMVVTAEVDVVGSRYSERQNGDEDRSLELQITSMALEKPGASSAVAALERGMKDA